MITRFRLQAPRLRNAAGALAGLAAALIAMEGVVRLFVTPNGPPLPEIRGDAIELPVIISRQMEEGLGVAHFSAAGARLTGNAPIADAPTAVILGDSYVVAREVPDGATMGALLERLARTHQRPLNVRQYGWRGASPARYAAVAADVRSRWSPAIVLIPISDDDLDERAALGPAPRLRIDGDANPTVVLDSTPAADVAAVATPPRSVLAMLIERRWHQVLDRSPLRVRRFITRNRPDARVVPQSGPVEPRPPLELIPRAVVRALARAYGRQLVLLYVADVRVVGGEQVTESERLLLEACAAERVVCASTRPSMLVARQRGIVARGFSTTTLGVGHLNADGHQLVASEMWDLIQPRLGALASR